MRRTLLGDIVRRHPITSYFLMAYGLSWLVSLPHILAVWGFVPDVFQVGFALKQWIGPALAGLVMAAVLGGRPGLKQLQALGRTWRARPLWYAVVLVVPPVLVLLGVLLVSGLPNSQPDLGSGFVASYVGAFLLVFIAVGFPEELGWRGFALPRLQERYGPFRGSLLLGALWALWHLPYFLTPDHGGGPGTDLRVVALSFVAFTGLVVALAFLFTFVANTTRGSVFLVALMHTAIDAPQLVWLPLLLPVGIANSTYGELTLDTALLVTFGVAALSVLVATRGRLGCGSSGAVGPVRPSERGSSIGATRESRDRCTG